VTERLHPNTCCSGALVAVFFKTKIIGVFCMYRSAMAVSIPLSCRHTHLAGAAAQVPEKQITSEITNVDKAARTELDVWTTARDANLTGRKLCLEGSASALEQKQRYSASKENTGPQVATEQSSR
jgi:hypothetical protein